MTLTLDADGRVLLPKSLLDELRVEPGASLRAVVRSSGDGAPTLEITPEEGGAEALGGDWDVSEILRRQYEERARKHAGLDLL